MIRIITTKRLKEMIALCDKVKEELQDLKGAHIHLHGLYKGLSNKYKYDMGIKEDVIKVLQSENKKLKAEVNRLRESLNKTGKK